MAGLHTFKVGGKNVTMFAIDHSVGRNGTNRPDDVQLVQFLINQSFVTFSLAEILKPGGGSKGLSALKVDGICGPNTLAAILYVQNMLKKTRGCRVDGRVDAIKQGGSAAYDSGHTLFKSINLPYFNTMYLLGEMADKTYGHRAVPITSLPEPLRTSLARSAMTSIASDAVRGVMRIMKTTI